MILDERLERIVAMLAVLVERQQVRDWRSVEEFARIVGRAEFTCREWCRLGPHKGGEEKQRPGCLRRLGHITRGIAAVSAGGAACDPQVARGRYYWIASSWPSAAWRTSWLGGTRSRHGSKRCYWRCAPAMAVQTHRSGRTRSRACSEPKQHGKHPGHASLILLLRLHWRGCPTTAASA